MPTYEYECGSCGTFDEFQRITDDPLSLCPTCGSSVRRLISSGTGIIFKGSGFYATDSRNAGKNHEASKQTSGDKDGASGETKGEAKGDAKTETKTGTEKKETSSTTTAAKD